MGRKGGDVRPVTFMRRTVLLLGLAAAAAPAGAQPQALGVYGSWGALRDSARCYAIAEPHQRSGGRDGQAFASVSYRPGRGGGQLHIRLSRAKRESSAVFLRIDGRSFQLAGRGADVWAPDGAADEEILAMMRTGLDLVVETRAEGGAYVRDQYRLRGAATAIDAAAIACAPRR